MVHKTIPPSRSMEKLCSRKLVSGAKKSWGLLSYRDSHGTQDERFSRTVQLVNGLLEIIYGKIHSWV